jgi:hypothetical protein
LLPCAKHFHHFGSMNAAVSGERYELRLMVAPLGESLGPFARSREEA